MIELSFLGTSAAAAIGQPPASTQGLHARGGSLSAGGLR
jgi:hypothetical protein